MGLMGGGVLFDYPPQAKTFTALQINAVITQTNSEQIIITEPKSTPKPSAAKTPAAAQAVKTKLNKNTPAKTKPVKVKAKHKSQHAINVVEQPQVPREVLNETQKNETSLEHRLEQAPPVIETKSTPTNVTETITQANEYNSNQIVMNSALTGERVNSHQTLSVSKTNSKSNLVPLPWLLKSSQPVYPEEARWEGRTGKVTLQFHISQRGYVHDAHVQSTSGHDDLDHAALKSLGHWRFQVNDNRPLGEWYSYSFRFELN
jgi:TonB family protein